MPGDGFFWPVCEVFFPAGDNTLPLPLPLPVSFHAAADIS
nr:hypothetical protein [Citrobacter freundii]